MNQQDMDFFEKLFRSLETEMRERFDTVNQRFDGVDARLDQANARLERIGGLVNGGSRALTRLAEWSEKTDTALADVLRRMTETEARLRKLEERSHGGAA
jgi:chromosome segregation ATPase